MFAFDLWAICLHGMALGGICGRRSLLGLQEHEMRTRLNL